MKHQAKLTGAQGLTVPMRADADRCEHDSSDSTSISSREHSSTASLPGKPSARQNESKSLLTASRLTSVALELPASVILPFLMSLKPLETRRSQATTIFTWRSRSHPPCTCRPHPRVRRGRLSYDSAQSQVPQTTTLWFMVFSGSVDAISG